MPLLASIPLVIAPLTIFALSSIVVNKGCAYLKSVSFVPCIDGAAVTELLNKVASKKKEKNMHHTNE
ncbi:hypothetical protein AMS58_10865 [Pseudoalteromonas porphyrae]|uniref:Uncharacterized protein n=1 Tax=Pseudoalteromonas porphyrae TaxID=187330 RepID=A0A0N1EL16_9GAMM|nr:hypothetical protein ADS77_08870 [Pseudoalteromonas porphyrae]KPH94739.1 hypothetical protein AMS58_10865 [Pseudoalteromonas porphyrae]